MLFIFGIDIFDRLETMRLAISAIKWVISNSDIFIGGIWLRSIRVTPILNLKDDFFFYENQFLAEKVKQAMIFFSITSEKSHQNLSKYVQFSFKKIF